MKNTIILIIILLAGLATGIALFFQFNVSGETQTGSGSEYKDYSAPEDIETVKLDKQFIVPVIKDGTVASLVIASIALEVEAGLREEIFRTEARLRSALLATFFEHSNAGTFSDNFIESRKLVPLVRSLGETSKSIFGEKVKRIFLTEISRQDVFSPVQ